MISPGRRKSAPALNLQPCNGLLLDVHDPAVVHLVVGNATKKYEQWLGVCQRMSVASTGCFTNDCDGVPDSNVVFQVEQVQIIAGQSASLCGSPVHKYLILLVAH